jgi:hypothetical protein
MVAKKDKCQPVLWDHSMAERIAKQCSDLKFYVVWWTYSANYSEPQIVLARTGREAFAEAFPFQVNLKEKDFHKYAAEIQNSGKFKEL